MRWKEQYRQTFWWPESRENPQKVMDFISTEIIEKLIEDISQLRDKVLKCESPVGSDAPLTTLKAARLIERIDALDVLDEGLQQLRDKWL